MLHRRLQYVNIHFSGCAVIQSDLLTLCSQTSLLAHSRTNSERPRSLSLLSTAHLLCLLSPAPWGLSRDLEPDWTAKVSQRNVGFLVKESILHRCILIFQRNAASRGCMILILVLLFKMDHKINIFNILYIFDMLVVRPWFWPDNCPEPWQPKDF